MPDLRALGVVVRRKNVLARALFAPLLALIGLSPNATESAKANGETRSLSLVEPHTNEAGTFTYMVNGAYDQGVLEKLNWFMRDWRHDEQIRMDPKLFDIVWEVYRESGSNQPVEVLSGYRSPDTNAMLRRRSRQVAEHSQHILGKAMDAHFLDVPVSRIRDIGMRMQDGGVGFYPTGATPWVHLDSGSVRYWPRMSRDALVRLFPDGKTVHVPADGVPLPGYEQARAEIEARGGSVFAATAYTGKPGGLLAFLFGGGEEEGDEAAVADAPRGGRTNIAASASSFAVGRQGAVQIASAQPDAISRAKRDLPRGETFLGPAPSAASSQGKTAKPQVVASLESHDASDALSLVAPKPPHRPTDPVSTISALGPAPMPPARPVEFAALQPGAAAQGKNDAIAALLMRRLPGVITRGVGGSLPKNALALADDDAPIPPERTTLLAKAAALSAPLPLVPTAPLLAPLERAARLYAPLPPIGPLKPALVAARIDPSNFEVMTAPKTPVAPLGTATRPQSPRADALIVALVPDAEGAQTFQASAVDADGDGLSSSSLDPLAGPAASLMGVGLRGAN